MSYTQSTTYRVTLQPVIYYEVRVDGNLKYSTPDYQSALDYVIAWRAEHVDKKRIRMNMRGDSEWKCSPVMYVEK